MSNSQWILQSTIESFKQLTYEYTSGYHKMISIITS